MNTANFFNDYFQNAEVNSILVMECDGTIKKVNHSFTKNFGYENEEISGKNFKILFLDGDIEKQKPDFELKKVVTSGQAKDENYIVDKEGHPIWCTGESLLVRGEQDKKYIVKDIVNLQAKKQLQLFLTEIDDLLERIFEHTKDIAIMILDGSMKIEKVNNAFLQLFEIDNPPADGSPLSKIDHEFWNSEEMKKVLRKILVHKELITNRQFSFTTKSGELKTVRLDSKLIDRQSPTGRKIFILIQEVE